MENTTECVTTETSCLTRIRSLYSTFTEAERRIADNMLADSGRMRTMSIAEVAQVSTVGLASVNRFCTKLGYSGFAEMKLALAVELLSPQHKALEPIREGDDVPIIFHKTLQFAIQSLNDTAEMLDARSLTLAAHAIATAHRLEFYAVGGLSGPIAMLAQYRFMMLNIASAAFTEHTQQVISAGLLRDGDAAIGFSHSGESEATTRALAAARNTGATTICITSAAASPLAQAAEIVLLTSAQEHFVWADTVASRMPMLGVIDALYATVALLKREQVPRTDTGPAQP